MARKALLLLGSALSLVSRAEAQNWRLRQASGFLSGQLSYVERKNESSDSFTLDSVDCSANLSFFANGMMKYFYSYRWIHRQVWDYSARRPFSTPYKIDETRISYFSGDVTIPGDRGPAPANFTKRRPFADSVVGNQRLLIQPDSSVDFQYRNPGQIPVVIVAEKIHIGWDGRRTVEVPRRWYESTAWCEPYARVWLQQTGLHTTQGALYDLTGEVDKILPGTNRHITVVWSLKPGGSSRP